MNRAVRIALVLAGMLISAEILAQTAPAYPPQSHFLSDLAKVTSFLVLIAATIALSLWVARRAGHFQQSMGGHLKVLDTLPVGTREKIVLLQVGRQQLLVGITAGHMETLHVLQENISCEPKTAGLQQVAAQWLQGRKQ